MKKQLIISTLILLFLILGTLAVTFYGEGYGINFQQGKIQISGTGLLVATSSPDGAEVLVNGHLTTATNNTINLIPGNYKVEIFKEGYFPWYKEIKVKKEVVSKAEALLLPTAPELQNLTNTGIANPIIDPTLTKIAYTVSSQSAQRNGIYVFNLNSNNLISLSGSETQIANDQTDNFSTAQLSWSPDGNNLLATVSSSLKTTTYLLNANSFNTSPQDVTETLADVQNNWNNQIKEKTNNQILGLNKNLKTVIKNDFKILSISPDESKILYIASVSATIPEIITPALIGVDSTPQDRNIQTGKIYVYDIKEDRNYPIPFSPSNNEYPLHWLNDSKHLVVVENKKVEIEEYDGGNKTTIYAGPFVDSFAYPWPDGSKIVISTNLGNSQILPNLYTISLK